MSGHRGTQEDGLANGILLQLALDPDPRSVPLSRAVVRGALSAGTSAEVLDTALLLVTELVTNAVRHAGTQVLLRVRHAPARLRVEVLDGRAEPPPVAVASAADSEGGRGLALVEALAAAWGCETRRTGKSVWFELDVA